MSALRVFIVDDDRDFARSLGNLISLDGHQVELAHSGEEAIRRFREADYDITFMDIRLPGLNGVESFFQIRNINPLAKVWMMTAYNMEELTRLAIEGGAVGFMSKPLEMSAVRDTLESVKPTGIVLVADDDPEFSQTLATYLTNSGYKVLRASTGQEAVDKVVANGIDALILDFRLPILNGLEVYLELKKRDRLVPIVLVSGYVDAEADGIEKLRGACGMGVLPKPFEPSVLLEFIDDLVARQGDRA